MSVSNMWACCLLLCWRLLSWCGAAQVGEPVPAPARHCRRPHSCRQDSETNAYRTALVLELSIWALWRPLAPCLSFLSGPEVRMSHPFLFGIDRVSWMADSLCHEAARFREFFPNYWMRLCTFPTKTNVLWISCQQKHERIPLGLPFIKICSKNWHFHSSILKIKALVFAEKHDFLHEITCNNSDRMVKRWKSR